MIEGRKEGINTRRNKGRRGGEVRNVGWTEGNNKQTKRGKKQKIVRMDRRK